MVVVVLLIVLVGLSGRRFTTSSKRRTMTQCQANLQKIYLALSIYSSDNKGVYPAVASAESSEVPLSLLIPRSTTVTEMFICPGTDDRKLPEGEPFTKRTISYAYYMGFNTNADPASPLLSDRQLDTLPSRAGSRVFSFDGKKPGNNHHADGGNIVFLSGETIASGPKAARDLLFPTNVVLLNPRK